MDSRKQLKVLQVVGELGMGGAETWLMELLRLWSKNGNVQMDFLLTSGKVGLFDKEAEKMGARLYYIPYDRKNIFEFRRKFRGLLKTGKYDAIHDHADYASGLHFFLGAGCLPPVRVTHVHNPIFHIEVNYGNSWLRRRTARFGKKLVNLYASHVCGTSAETLRSYGFTPGAVKPQKVSVLHCGINVESFCNDNHQDRPSVLKEFGWPGDVKIVLFAGRLDQEMEINHPQNHKNSWLALNVLRIAVQEDPRLRLLMAGAGGNPEQLRQVIESWKLTDKLRVIGVRRDITRLMHASSLLFFPSRQEGLGMVAVEAQAAGLPVLASTAVPRECIVIPDLYTAVSLEQPLEEWSARLKSILEKPRADALDCGRLVNASAFSVENSALRLEAIYAGNA